MRIWMSINTGQSNNKYAVRMVLGVFGCIILAMLTAVGGVMVSIKMEEHKEVVSLLILLIGTLLIVWCAWKIGRMADEILSVRSMKEKKDGHSVVCDVRFPNSRTGKATYLVCRGYECEDELLYHLERRVGKSCPFSN